MQRLVRSPSRLLCAAATPTAPQWLDPACETHRRWVQRMRCFIFDIDGVIHTPAGPISGASTTLSQLRDRGIAVRFLTNNATKSPHTIVSEFADMGIDACTSEVTTSACVAADYLCKQGLSGSPVYVIGERSLLETLDSRAGVRAFGGPDDAGKSRRTLLDEGHSIATLSPPADAVGAVVIGADGDANYYKIAMAAAYLRGNPNCLFVVTNPDPAFTLAPRGDGIPATLAPAAGVWARAVAMVSGREPDIVCGKPSASLGQHMLQSYGLEPATTCMVGDRIDTDIEFGRSAGMATLFVDSGSTAAATALSAQAAQRPDFLAPSIAVLAAALRSNS